MTNSIGKISAEIKDTMNKLARMLDEIFNGIDESQPKRWGFVLLTFKFGEKDNRLNYISNASRKDVISAMKKWIAAQEASMKKESQAVENADNVLPLFSQDKKND